MEIEKSFGIGELSRRTKRSVHTIRWYEAQGLMPRVERDAGRRRVYTHWHVEWLGFIDRLRISAMPVREMKRYAALIARGDDALAEGEALLRAHRETLSERLRDMNEAMALIDRKLKYYALKRSTRERGRS